MAKEAKSPSRTDPEPKPAPDQPASVLEPRGLVSILIPCWGQLEYTKLCVPSVLRHSRSPYELIFLDIGSLEARPSTWPAWRPPPRCVNVVRTATDLGIPEAVAEALAQARGEHVVLLNNDTVVPASWLNQMIALASASPHIGLVGPMSNYAAPPQLVETVPYRIGPRRGARRSGGKAAGEEHLVDTAAVSAFAQEHRQKDPGKWVEAERLGGFCLLIKRQVLERFGSLEAWSGLGLFDTDILSAKARQAGFRLAVCRDLFVHHFGTRTFAHGAPQTEPLAAA